MIHGILSDSSTWNTFKNFLPGDLSEAFNVGPTSSTMTNARLISDTHLPAALTGFGVEKVNLIGHSKGGLDASQAARMHPERVENLITIGSPLQGSEYADHLLASHGTGLALLDVFYGGAAVTNELSVATRQGYYSWRPTPPRGVQEWNFAGTEYRPEDTYCFARRFLLELTHIYQVFSVINDGYVPFSRTLAPWATLQPATFPDSHISDSLLLPSTPGPPAPELLDANLAALAVAFMQPSAVGPMAASSAQTSSSVPIVPSASTPPPNVSGDAPHTHVQDLAVTLSPGQTQMINIQIDLLVSQATFHVTYTPRTALVAATLIAPSGAQFALSQAPSFPALSYTASSPQAGTWRIRVLANSLVTSLEAFADLNSPVTLTASTDKLDYAANERMNVTARVANNGTGVSGATLTCTATSRWPNNYTLGFVDEGGGTHTTGFVPSPGGGRWTFRIIATGSYCVIPVNPSATQCSTFEREASIPMVTAAPSAAAVASISQGVATDTNGNGLYDNLTFNVTIDPVVYDGDYELFAKLTGGDDGRGPGVVGPLIDTVDTIAHLMHCVHPSCPPGEQTMALVFDGRAIHNSGLNGPYTLSELSFISDHEDLLIEKRTGTLATSLNYRFYDFDGASLAFGVGEDHGADVDGDGLFDNLIVELEVTANPGYQGGYMMSAALTDLKGHVVAAFPQTYEFLNPGSNLLQLSYSGDAISLSGVNGPYRVGGFTLQHVATPSIHLDAGVAYVTRFYQACQFQGSEGGCVAGHSGGGYGARGNPRPPREQ